MPPPYVVDVVTQSALVPTENMCLAVDGYRNYYDLHD
jgi:hypothetical protein